MSLNARYNTERDSVTRGAFCKEVEDVLANVSAGRFLALIHTAEERKRQGSPGLEGALHITVTDPVLQMVAYTMEAVCILFGSKPNWKESKNLLAKMTFMDELKVWIRLPT